MQNQLKFGGMKRGMRTSGGKCVSLENINIYWLCKQVFFWDDSKMCGFVK